MKRIKKAGRIALSAIALSLVAYVSEAQVGIGITVPQAKLHVYDGSVLGTTPELPGENDPFFDPDFIVPLKYTLQWFHDKSAFRSIGERLGTGALDAQNIGGFSFASGYENFATGTAAAVFGLRSSATGSASFATGHKAYASGNYSFAFGDEVTASGGGSVAMGEWVSTNGKNHSFVLGSKGGQLLQNDANNQMVMGFAGGYKLLTSNIANVGVLLSANSNSWSSISDVNKKENFASVNGEDFLNKIASMKLTSWNYKGQDSRTLRHYGPMAQDFYKAFGKDDYGTIGTDTTINQADFDGINLIAIQALVRRTDELLKKNNELLAEIAEIRAQVAVGRSATDPKKRKRNLLTKR
ncbi:tail fiber domain-containing protein [Dyadobacter sp. MSC1_007]|jgi:hypothetical protein|uniref:tail fiber domain-containing protein n=1 Tax=Dyadobacter sp. MSC1_007 TaxID=2909264 RepID=UPI00202DC264|nr:tail fiber domain-containing protein [Dyadobacter sp. MSC1_007]